VELGLEPNAQTLGPATKSLDCTLLAVYCGSNPKIRETRCSSLLPLDVSLSSRCLLSVLLLNVSFRSRSSLLDTPSIGLSLCPIRLRLGWYQALPSCIHWSATIHQRYVRVSDTHDFLTSLALVFLSCFLGSQLFSYI
jgi:hypothetical protein